MLPASTAGIVTSMAAPTLHPHLRSKISRAHAANAIRRLSTPKYGLMPPAIATIRY